MTQRVYVLTSIDYSQYEVITVFEALTDAMSYADELIAWDEAAHNWHRYPDVWTEKLADLRWDLFIREFTKIPEYGEYLSIEEHHVVRWSKAGVEVDGSLAN